METKLLFKAIRFAADKHESQRRKNSAATPYINHPIEVAEHLCRVGDISDTDILIGALLHDTVEDTDTSEAEIRSEFGDEVAKLVMEGSDDKTLEKAERKQAQIESAPKKCLGAKQIKIADKSCNLRSILVDPPKGWSTQRQFEYFQWAEKGVAGLKGVNAKLDEEVQKVLETGLSRFSADNTG